MNLDFLRQLHRRWCEHNLLGDTANLDFTTIPYWGDEDDHLENNWSGKRSRALASMLAVLAHDPDTGIIDYGDTDVRHQSESQIVLEYLDFYRTDDPNGQALKYLVFDSRFTNYENLAQLDERNIKFITIRRRVRKYCRRWLIEKSIAEQVDFFHLNRLSSSMVIKVGFDLVMTILAHNLYRLLALELGRYQHLTDQSVFDRFIYNAGTVAISKNDIRVSLKKKRDLPQLLTALNDYKFEYPWLYKKRLVFDGASYT